MSDGYLKGSYTNRVTQTNRVRVGVVQAFLLPPYPIEVTRPLEANQCSITSFMEIGFYKFSMQLPSYLIEICPHA